MKKIGLLVFLLFITVAGFAQDEEQAETKNKRTYHSSYDQGNILISGGISLGIITPLHIGDLNPQYNESISLPLMLHAEYGFHELVSGGIGVAFFRREYLHKQGTNSFGRNHYNVGFRGTFHYTSLLPGVGIDIEDENLDLYISLVGGIDREIYWEKGRHLYREIYRQNETNFYFGPVFGLRYYVIDNLGFYAEAGRGPIGIAAIGATFRW